MAGYPSVISEFSGYNLGYPAYSPAYKPTITGYHTDGSEADPPKKHPDDKRSRYRARSVPDTWYLVLARPPMTSTLLGCAEDDLQFYSWPPPPPWVRGEGPDPFSLGDRGFWADSGPDPGRYYMFDLHCGRKYSWAWDCRAARLQTIKPMLRTTNRNSDPRL